MTSLTRCQFDATVTAIARTQEPSGRIPWVPGGKTDPWNLVEAAMALDAGGQHDAAAEAYRWLRERQLPHGGWYSYYVGDDVVDRTLDTNVSAYVCTGTWHHHLATRDSAFLRAQWPVVEQVVTHVLEFQRADGGVAWRADDPLDGALLTGSSSVHMSLRCAVAVAEELGHRRPEWELAADAVAEAISLRPDDFLDKRRWAMDWYYPVLAGVVRGDAGRRRIAERWDDFVVSGRGVRCVSDRPWITAAETCELVLALDCLGMDDEARMLFEWAQFLRHDNGSYWCGMNFEGERFDRPGEYFTADQPTWNSAAVVLAADALAERGPASAIFRDLRTSAAGEAAGSPSSRRA